MPIDLNAPLDTANLNPDEQALLADLQGNILKGHGRGHTANLFLRFDPAQAPAVKSWIGSVAPDVTTTAGQLATTAAFKAAMAAGAPAPAGKPVLFVFLSAKGYEALGVAMNRRPGDARFAAGQKASRTILTDPPSVTWDLHFRGDVHALVIIGAETPADVMARKAALVASMPSGVTVLGVEMGKGWHNENGDGIEHFGYVDGRSQPLMLRQDIDRERTNTDGISVWNPAFPIGQVLVPDPAGQDARSFGSYLVFRKLEQNVKGFKDREEALADHLGLTGDDRERAGAMIVGRFEDGTPVVLQKAEGMHNPVPNNFDYRDDPNALKCPFHGHIRKTNPRGESVRPGLAPDLASERAHIMARRGITYGKRKAKKKGKGVDFTDQPTDGVGLLFMAYQSNIGAQFEFTQASWANNQNFVNPGTGIDPVIGQGGVGGQTCPVGWGADPEPPTFKKFDFRSFVTMKGGEYFFAPSVSALRSL